MKFSVAATLILMLIIGASLISTQTVHDGKYNKKKYSHGNHGKYVHTNEGDYVEDLDRYRYVHYDDGDRGRYIHTHIPYDGGFGNYEGGHEPFRNPPYDASGLYADSSLDNPFKANEYDIKPPSIYLEYGTPESEYVEASSRQEKQTSAAVGLDPRASTFPGTVYLPAPKPHTEYGPPKRTNNNSSFKHLKGTGSLRRIPMETATTSRGQETKLNFITTAPDSVQNRITVSQTATSEPVTSTTPRIKLSTSASKSEIPTRIITTMPTRTSSVTTDTTSTSNATEETAKIASVVVKPSIEEQLQRCRAELQATLLKIGHGEQTKGD